MRRRDPSRRQILAGLGVSAAAGVIGCGHDLDPPDPDALADPADASATGSGDAAANTCAAPSELSAEQLLAHVETMVVLCMENRSFDHFLGSLRKLEGRDDVDGLTGFEHNTSTSGHDIFVHKLDDFTPEDPPHNWDASHAQWDDGANDGFVRAHAGSSEADVMGYHVRSQLPVTYALADQSAICNRWFCACLGPTWPNRLFLHGATSNGSKANLPVVGFTSIFDRLADANIDGINYFSDVAWATGAYGKVDGLRTIERFFEDAASGSLPPFAIVDPAFYGGGANDDHPDHDVRLGQALISSIVHALGQSPQWSRSLLVITYDEHGGFFDHVPPPTTVDERADFQRLGFRVPAMVIGPTVRAGCAIDQDFEHCSVAATATKRWNLEPLNERAAHASDLSACIDPARIDNPLPPPTVPQLKISRRGLRERQARARAIGQTSHSELAAAMDRRGLPARLDRRADADAIAERVLAWGERLGAIRWVD